MSIRSEESVRLADALADARRDMGLPSAGTNPGKHDAIKDTKVRRRLLSVVWRALKPGCRWPAAARARAINP